MSGASRPTESTHASPAHSRINRRKIMRLMSAWLGGTALAGGARLAAALETRGTGSSNPSAGSTPLNADAFTAEQIAFLDEIAETILPATHTPGAKDAHTGAFMALMVTECYSPAERQVFLEGMGEVDEATCHAHGVTFMAASPAQRLEVLERLDVEQKHFMDAREAKRRKSGEAHLDPHAPAHYFRMMKELSLLGFFTSEIGSTQALRYVDTPGRYDACVPYHPGEPSLADHM